MRADRLVSIVMLLQSRGKMTTAALATELEVSRRTILRDIDALSLAGVPLYADGGHGGGVALDEQYRTSLTGLQAAEVQALFTAGNQPLLAEIGLGDAAKQSERKLSAALPTQHRSMLEHFQQRIYIDPLWWWHDAEQQGFWGDLQEAVHQDRCIAVVYENYNGEITERLLEPYSLVAKSALWYLVAKEVGQPAKGWRTFRVARLQQVQPLTQTFVRDLNFDLPTYWQTHLAEFVTQFSEYEFTLRIHPDRVQFARWIAPGRSQHLSTEMDGWLTMRFQLDSILLAKMMVFGLGNQCEVVAPIALQRAVAEECASLLAHWGENDRMAK